MAHWLTLAKRANDDEDRLLSPLAPLLSHTSQGLQMHLVNMLEHGKRFGITTFLRHSLQQNLATLMLAGHLAGIRRTDLMLQQSPKPDTELSLELSFFSNVMQFFRRKKNIDLGALQKQYNSVAFEVLTNVSDNIKKDLAATTDKLIKGGAHVREAKKILGDKFAEYGIRPASKSQLETIFRTQTQIAYSAGKYEAERENPFIYDALWGYKYVTAGDDRVRPSHAILDGVTLPKDDPFWQQFYPPNGFNCRCQAIPLFKPAKIVLPHKVMPDGSKVKPDKGFAWSAGKVFSAV